MKRLCIAVLLVLVVIQAQTFGKLWKQVDQVEKKSLPGTVTSYIVAGR